MPSMPTHMTSKGQVTIPKPVRDHLGLEPGMGVEFTYTDDGDVVIRPTARRIRRKAKSRFAPLVGTGKRVGMPTDAYMALIRGYDQDGRDPGFKKR